VLDMLHRHGSKHNNCIGDIPRNQPF